MAQVTGSTPDEATEAAKQSTPERVSLFRSIEAISIIGSALSFLVTIEQVLADASRGRIIGWLILTSGCIGATFYVVTRLSMVM